VTHPFDVPYIDRMARTKSVVRVGPQGRVVIPAAVRRDLGIAPGDELSLSVSEDRLVLEPRAAAAARARGMLRHLATGVSPVDELIAARREEAHREAAE